MNRRTLLLVLLLVSAGCATTPKVTIKADASITGRGIQYLQDGDRFQYGSADDLRDVLGGLPPPPPTITRIPGTPGTAGTAGTPGTPGNPAIPPGTLNPNIYNSLLGFLQSGPGGGALNIGHLQQITPSLVAVAQLVLANPGFSLTQLAGTSQGSAFLAVAQGILQPLGLWNYNTLNQWLNYVRPRLGTLQGILLSLYNQLQIPLSPGSAGTPGTPGTAGTSGTTGVPDQIIVNSVNPFAVVSEIFSLYRGKDWLLFAERGPNLIHSLIRHVGFSKPRIVLYGSRSRFYGPGVVTTRREDGKRSTYGLNLEGFFINEQTSGAGVFYQGADDVSLVYALIEVKDRRVETLDVIASDRYALLKRASGGDLKLLDRASTHSTGLLQADVALGENHNYHARVVIGSTPFASMGGVAGEVEYGEGIFTGRVGGGVFVEDAYDSDSENLLGYLETENTIRTPYLKIKDETRENSPELKLWASTTLAVAGMTTRALSKVTRNGRKITSTWTGQGDIRIVPELHTVLDTELVRYDLYSGVTLAAVPHGRVDLDVPYQSLRLYPIRLHIGGSIRLRLSKIHDYVEKQWSPQEVKDGTEEWWTEEEKQAYRNSRATAPTSEWIFLLFEGVGEISRLFHKGRLSISLEVFDFSVGFLTELESYLDEEFHDVRVGGGVSWGGFYVQGLSSIKDDDYRLQVGFEFVL